MNNYSDKFDLIRQKQLIDISVEAFEFLHKKTGAKVVFFLNDDFHRVFGVGFKTLPYSDNGVAHILEHCVLAGSKKYPLKDPFFQLIKRSLQTFLNAMTYPDKTVFPVASLNKKDFFNLVDVYLDSILNPLLKKEIFQQEGWHYESKESSLAYGGIVFNEMKGAYSPPESLMSYYRDKILYRGSQYQFSAGGYPLHIPSLSYDEFCQFHRDNYHPSNSISFFYGDNDIKSFLNYLNDSYFCSYERKNESSSIGLVKPWEQAQEQEIFYPFLGEDKKNGTFLSLSFLLEEMSLENDLSFALLSDILLGSDSAPLYKALQNSGLGESVISEGYSSYGKQTSFHVGLRGSELKHKIAFKKLFLKTMKELRDKGIEKGLIEGSLSKYEFFLRELDNGSEPKGLKFLLKSMMLDFYKLDYFEAFAFEKNLENLKKRVKNKDFFPLLINQYFLQNNHHLLLSFIPSQDTYQQEQKAFANQLYEAEKIMGEKGIISTLEENQRLVEFQNTADKKEAINSLPSLSLKDLNQGVQIITEQWYSTREGERPLFYHSYHCNKISYIQVAFNINNLSEEEILYLEIFSLLLTEIGTAKKTYESLIEAIKLSFGRLLTHTHFFYNKQSKLEARFLLDFAITDNKYSESFSLLSEIIKDIDFSNKNRIFTVLSNYKSRLYLSFRDEGHLLSQSFLASGLNSLGAIEHRSSSYPFYQFLENVLTNFDSKFMELRTKLLSLKGKVFNLRQSLFNLTSVSKAHFVRYVPIILEALSTKKYNSNSFLNFDLEKFSNLAIKTSSAIQFVSYGSVIKPPFSKFIKGDFLILRRILSTIYLLENIRLKGGAYGCFCKYNANDKSLILTSYRDPHLERTLSVFREFPKFLQNLSLSKQDFLQLLIGSVGALDRPLSQYAKGIKSLQMYWRGEEWSEIQQERDEILSSNFEKMKSYIPLFEKFSKSSRYAVFGSSDKIEQNKLLFEKFINLS